MTIKNIFTLALNKVSDCGVNPEKVGYNEKGIEVFLDESLVKVATFYLLYVEPLR
jgi:hypothetical protein